MRARAKLSKKEKDVVVVYHGDCLDGFGAAWAAWKKFGDKAEYYAARSRTAPPTIKGKQIYLLDYTYYEPELLQLMEKNRVTAIDHHISMRGEVALTEGGIFNNDHSGAVLAWKHFHSGKRVPRVLKYIEDNDIRSRALPKTREVLAYVQMLPFDFRIWGVFIRNFERPAFRRQALHDAILLRRHFENLASRIVADNAEVVEFAGYKVSAANAPHMFSEEVGRRLYEGRPPFAIVWRIQNGSIKVSLRGSGRPDLTKIAGRFGGGGHKDAAGFTVPLAKGFPWKVIIPKTDGQI